MQTEAHSDALLAESDDSAPRIVVISTELAGQRLDQALAGLFDDYSRSRLQDWIKQGRVMVDGRQWRGRDKLRGGEKVELRPVQVDEVVCRPQDIPLDIRFEDEHLLVVAKPAGLVVHPAAGNPDGTLQNALLFHAPGQIKLPRAGIVHRLDKDTSGLLVVAKSELAHRHLVRDLQERRIKREYRALVTGRPTAGGTVEAPIGRHPTQRVRMAVTPSGKPAVSHYRVEERFARHTWLRVELESGRTHQIRVHMAHIGLPIVGDPLYGGRVILPPRPTDAQRAALQGFKRQALHAYQLTLDHPASGESLQWRCEIPEDLAGLLQVLRDGG